MKRFALIGAAGYVAPRHMKAIKETGNILVAAMDISDSVGIIDSYFPEASFFTETERFERHLELLKKKGEGVDYLVVCTPNYLHDSHCRLGLRSGADVICEKPLAENPWNLDQLKIVERETGKRVYNILQLRLHPSLIELKKKIKKDKHYNVKLTYITPRGLWYDYSWKGIEEKSGGIMVNIGIHFFDLLLWLFDTDIIKVSLERYEKDLAVGFIKMKNAWIEWFLSTNKKYAPEGKKYRELKIDNDKIRFDDVFEDLHISVYKDILNGGGFGINDAKPAINLIYDMKRKY